MDEETIQKIEEWNALDEETRQSLIESNQLDEKIGAILKRLPGIRTVYGLGSAAYRAAKGDWTGAALSAGSAIPGPVGWGFVGADIARDMAKGGGPKGAIDRRTKDPVKDITGKTPNTGQPKTFNPKNPTDGWTRVNKDGTPVPSQKKNKNSKYTFNFPKNFKTSTSAGSAKDDAYNTKFNVNRKGVDKENNATTYKSRTRAQVRADDYADMQASKRSRNRR